MRTFRMFHLAATAAMVLALSWGSAARAGWAYAYSEQGVNNLQVGVLSVGGGSLSNASVSSTTSSDAASFVSGISNTGTTDVPQAYIGGGVAPAENSYYNPTAGTTLIPKSPASNMTAADFAAVGSSSAIDYSRSDAMVQNAANLFSTGVNAANVAETNLSVGGNPVSSASAHWAIVGNFTYTAGTGGAANQQLTLNYSWANLYKVDVSPGGTSHADYNIDFSLRDQTRGVVVWHFDPNELNHGTDYPPNQIQPAPFGGTTPLYNSGTVGVWDPGAIFHNLEDGHVYQLTVSSGVNVSAVPEPSSLIVLAMGLTTLGGLHFRRQALARIG